MDLEYAYLYCKKWRQLSRQLGKRAARFQAKMAEYRDKVEKEMEEKMAAYLKAEGADSQVVWLEALQLAGNYLERLEGFCSKN